VYAEVWWCLVVGRSFSDESARRLRHASLRALLAVQFMDIASLDLPVGRAPHELPGEDVLHRTGSVLFGLRSE